MLWYHGVEMLESGAPQEVILKGINFLASDVCFPSAETLLPSSSPQTMQWPYTEPRYLVINLLTRTSKPLAKKPNCLDTGHLGFCFAMTPNTVK